MEKIVIFVIIMIVSSYFSKKKRKKATFTKKENDTMFFDDKGNKISESTHRSASKPTVSSTEKPQSISDALNELKNIFTNPAQNKPKPKQKPTQAPTPVYETNYGEVSNNENYTDSSEHNYKEVQSNYDTSYKRPEPKEVKNSYTIEKKTVTLKKDVFSNLFNSRNNLKKAVIITEIFNKKY